MRLLSYKKYLIFFASLALSFLTLGIMQPAWACSGGDYEDQEFQSAFSPELIGDDSCSPYYRSNRAFYLDHDDAATQSRQALTEINASEWSQWLKMALDETELYDLLYRLSAVEIHDLAVALTDPSHRSSLSRKTQNIYSRLSLGNTKLAAEAAFYLEFARQVEPIAMAMAGVDRWSRNPTPRDTSKVPALLQQGLAGVASATDPTLKARYAFQIIRLHFYSGDYPAALSAYNTYQSQLKAVTSIKYRSLQLAAGASYKQHDFATANYLHSLIFDQYEPLKKSAYLSFHPQEMADWEASLKLAKSTREKQILWQMYGIYADGVEAIRQIYGVDRRSDLLPLLLVRQVNIAEEGFNWVPGGNWMVRQSGIISGGDLDTLIKIADAGDTLKPEVWSLAVGHILALTGDTARADSYLKRAQAMPSSVPMVADQIRMSQLFSRAQALATADRKLEPYFAAELKWLLTKQSFPESRGQTLMPWVRYKLAQAYEAQGDWVRALLLFDRRLSPLYQDPSRVAALRKFVTTPPRSEFDAFLVSNASYTGDDYNEIEAIDHAFAGNLWQAENLLGGKRGASELSADPFTMRITDCHDCDFREKHARYTKLSFVQKMRGLSGVSGNSEDKAQAALSLANAFYNMSYYGNARDFALTSNGNFDPQSDRALSMTQAKKYYQMAAQLSRSSELQARATFGIAKCDQNIYFNSRKDNEPIAQVGTRPAFDTLIHQYSKTQFYREALQECGYLSDYASKR